MPEYLAPGVYMEEFEIGAKPIEGVSTSTAAFLGIAKKGPLDKPTLITNQQQFVIKFGSHLKKSYLAYAVEGFFRNGGKRCFIVRVAHDAKKAKIAVNSTNDNSLMLISALTEGKWGNDISIEVKESSSGSTILFLSKRVESGILPGGLPACGLGYCHPCLARIKSTHIRHRPFDDCSRTGSCFPG